MGEIATVRNFLHYNIYSPSLLGLTAFPAGTTRVLDMTPETNQRWVINEPTVVSETVDGETIVIHLETGSYYSLTGSAGEFWDLLQKGWQDPSLLASKYSAEPAQICAAWSTFLGELSSEDLIRSEAIASDPLASRVETEDVSPAMAKMPFVAPEVHKYEDMKELLLLDPIHDVAVGGWPQRA